MKTTAAYVEFIIPGVIILFSILVIILKLFSILELSNNPNITLTQDIKDLGLAAESLLGILSLSIAYILGVLSNNLGGFLLKRKATSIYNESFRKNEYILKELNYFTLRRIEKCNFSGIDIRREAAFMRAYCRVSSNEAAIEIGSHSSHIRIMRASLLSVFFLFFSFSFFAFCQLQWSILIRTTVVVAIIIIGSFSCISIINTYFYRLQLQINSTLAHFIAIRTKEMIGMVAPSRRKR